MPKVEVELDDELLAWATETAAANRLSVPGYIELLLLLESEVRRSIGDGRTLRTQAFMYRDGCDYFVRDEAFDRLKAAG